jgi:hypothetical protein
MSLPTAYLFLGNLDQIEALFPDLQGKSAELTNGVALPVEQVWVLLYQRLGAKATAGLLVAGRIGGVKTESAAVVVLRDADRSKKCSLLNPGDLLCCAADFIFELPGIGS